MSRSRTRWLGLAIRARQWALDEHSHALHEARAAEEAAQRAQQAASAALDAAHAQRDGLVSRHSFGADDLQRHVAHEAEVRGQSLRAQQQLHSAIAHGDTIRTQMQEVLAQRDAYQHRLQRVTQEADQRQARVDVRELDELWLLRPARSAEP